jgi:thiamine pyrophosphate-dependent acetolactate synthase large subunit-like protein
VDRCDRQEGFLKDIPGYRALAEAFRAEGTDVVFGLMGDANAHWTIAMKDLGATVIHARHEHSACGMADGYARATGRVGVASVTCGPGFTQIMTSLAISARGRIPLVVMVGDTASNVAFHLQQMDQAPLALATGARFIRVKHPDRILGDVREAFYTAQQENLPVVLSVPIDFQKRPFPWMLDYEPSKALLPKPQRLRPDPAIVSEVVDMIEAAERPVVLAGRGAVKSGAKDASVALAEQIGALVGTTLLAKGLFDDDQCGIGISGAYATNVGRSFYAESDLVLGVGASMSFFTSEAGYMYPNARVVQIDLAPHGLYQGLRTADVHMQADAKAGVDAILAEVLRRGIVRSGWRNDANAKRIAAEGLDRKPFPVAPNTVDPREALLELDRVIPPDWDIVCGSGHSFHFVTSHIRGRPAERYHVVSDFGAIGQALTTAIGVACARNDGKVLLLQGDGSLLMHIQELEVIKRQKIRLLIGALNDGAYGSEVHMLRGQKMDPAEAIFGKTDLASISAGFGVRSSAVTQLGQFERLFNEHQSANEAEFWDIRIADIASAQYRRLFYGEA